MRFKFLNISGPVSVFLVVLAGISLAMLISLAVAAFISRPALSDDVLKFFDKSLVVKSFEYNRASLLISIVSKVLQWSYFALALFLVVKFFSKNPLQMIVVIGYIALFFTAMYLILLPLSYFRGYVMEHAYGLSNQPLSSWFMDYFKNALIQIGLYTLALSVLNVLLVYTPRFWYIIAFFVLAVSLFIMILVYPLVIDPLFYDFKPLKDEVLQERIEEVTEKAGIEVDNILIADASRRTTRANAYFSGLGFSKRIVLYDNLVNDFSDDEIINVVAHEAGHWKSLHIFKSLLIGIMSGALLIFIIKIISDKYTGSNNLLLVLVVFVFFSLASFLTQPVQNAISRHFERTADRLTVQYTGDAQTQVSLFRQLARSNLSNVRPNEYIKYMLYSHPPIIERISSAIDQSNGK